MSFLEELSKRREAEFYAHISPEVKALVDKGQPITYEAYEKMKLNSYEFSLVYGLLDDVALVKVVRHCLANCGQRELGRLDVGTTYDEVLVGRLVPLLCSRLENAAKGRVQA